MGRAEIWLSFSSARRFPDSFVVATGGSRGLPFELDLAGGGRGLPFELTLTGGGRGGGGGGRLDGGRLVGGFGGGPFGGGGLEGGGGAIAAMPGQQKIQ